MQAWQDSDINMQNSVFINNVSPDWGGGGWLNQGTYQNVKFISNSAGRGGGFGTEGIPKFKNCLLFGNQASQGGGIYTHGAPEISLVNTLKYCLVLASCLSGFIDNFFELPEDKSLELDQSRKFFSNSDTLAYSKNVFIYCLDYNQDSQT